MIATVLRIGWINLKRDRVAQSLTFLLPLIFFSIFAGVFGGQGRSTTPRVRVAVVDEDGTEPLAAAGLQVLADVGDGIDGRNGFESDFPFDES